MLCSVIDKIMFFDIVYEVCCKGGWECVWGKFSPAHELVYVCLLEQERKGWDVHV